MTLFLSLALALESATPPGFGVQREQEMSFDCARTVEDACSFFGYQAWRVPALLQFEDAYTVDPASGSHMGGLTADYILPQGQKLHVPYVDEDHQQATSDAWKGIAAAQSADYAYVRGGGGTFYGRAATLFGRRPDTLVFRQASHFAEYFMMRLNGRTADADDTFKVSKPIRSVVLVAHATSGGFLSLSPNQGDSGIHYNELKNVDGQFHWALQPYSLEPRPTVGGAVVPSRLEIFGCNIGRAMPFLQQFRRAMNVSEVVAPKFFVNVFDSSGSTIASSIADTVGFHFLHDWRMARPDKITTKAGLVAAFQAANFADFQGNPPADFNGVPLDSAKWQGLFSFLDEANINKLPTSAGQFVEPGFGVHCNHELAHGDVGMGGPRLTCVVFYRYTREQLPRGLKRRYVIANDPGAAGNLRKNAAMAVLESIGELHDADFPIHQRWNNASRQEFIDSWNWSFTKRGSRVEFDAVRHEYTLLYPLIDHASSVPRGIATLFAASDPARVVADTVPKAGDADFSRIFARAGS